MRAQRVRGLAPLRVRRRLVLLGERGADRGDAHRLVAALDMGAHIAHEVHPAALPARPEDAPDRLLEALVGVRDRQLDPAQAAPDEVAQKRAPELLGLGRAHRQAQHLAPARGVDADGEHAGLGYHAPAITRLHVGRIEPQVGPVALDRARQERRHALVDRRAQPRDLRRGDPRHPRRLDQRVDTPWM